MCSGLVAYLISHNLCKMLEHENSTILTKGIARGTNLIHLACTVDHWIQEDILCYGANKIAGCIEKSFSFMFLEWITVCFSQCLRLTIRRGRIGKGSTTRRVIQYPPACPGSTRCPHSPKFLVPQDFKVKTLIRFAGQQQFRHN